MRRSFIQACQRVSATRDTSPTPITMLPVPAPQNPSTVSWPAWCLTPACISVLGSTSIDVEHICAMFNGHISAYRAVGLGLWVWKCLPARQTKQGHTCLSANTVTSARWRPAVPVVIQQSDSYVSCCRSVPGAVSTGRQREVWYTQRSVAHTEELLPCPFKHGSRKHTHLQKETDQT